MKVKDLITMLQEVDQELDVFMARYFRQENQQEQFLLLSGALMVADLEGRLPLKDFKATVLWAQSVMPGSEEPAGWKSIC